MRRPTIAPTTAPTLRGADGAGAGVEDCGDACGGDCADAWPDGGGVADRSRGDAVGADGVAVAADGAGPIDPVAADAPAPRTRGRTCGPGLDRLDRRTALARHGRTARGLAAGRIGRTHPGPTLSRRLTGIGDHRTRARRDLERHLARLLPRLGLENQGDQQHREQAERDRPDETVAGPLLLRERRVDGTVAPATTWFTRHRDGAVTAASEEARGRPVGRRPCRRDRVRRAERRARRIRDQEEGALPVVAAARVRCTSATVRNEPKTTILSVACPALSACLRASPGVGATATVTA